MIRIELKNGEVYYTLTITFELLWNRSHIVFISNNEQLEIDCRQILSITLPNQAQL